jgi:peroxiredoxin
LAEEDTVELEGTASQTAEFDVYSVARLLESITTESGRRFIDLASGSPVMLVFLRHAGCTFCREALADISQTRAEIEASGTQIVLVHMGDRSAVDQQVNKHRLQDVERICDSGQVLYDAFGLKRGSFTQLFGLKVWRRGIVAGLLRGHGRATPVADYRQMPGVFFVDKGLITRRFRHKSAADRPQYQSICAP